MTDDCVLQDGESIINRRRVACCWQDHIDSAHTGNQGPSPRRIFLSSSRVSICGNVHRADHIGAVAPSSVLVRDGNTKLFLQETRNPRKGAAVADAICSIANTSYFWRQFLDVA